MRSYCAIYVDVGYLLAAAATRVTGTSLRRGVDVDHPELIQALMDKAEQDSGLPLLRVNWYDSGARPGGMPDFVQDEIGLLPRVKLRLGRLSHAGEQKGVDLRIGLDLATHGRNRVVDVIYLVSGDDDLTEAVEEAQGHGVQLILLAVPGLDGRPHGVARHLQRAADGLVLLDGDTIDQVVRSRAIPEPLVPDGFKAASEVAEGQLAAGATGGSDTQPADAAADTLAAASTLAPATSSAAPAASESESGVQAHTAGRPPAGEAADEVLQEAAVGVDVAEVASRGAAGQGAAAQGAGAESAADQAAAAQGAAAESNAPQAAADRGAGSQGATSHGDAADGESAEDAAAGDASVTTAAEAGAQAPAPATAAVSAATARNGAPARGTAVDGRRHERRRPADALSDDEHHEPALTGADADHPPGPSPSLFAKRKATTLVPPPDPIWTTATGAEPSGSFVGASPELIDIVARQVVRSWCTTATPEDLALLKRQRPSIPPDLDRALLMDLSNRSEQYDIDEVSRHDLRHRFWQLLDQVKLT